MKFKKILILMLVSLALAPAPLVYAESKPNDEPITPQISLFADKIEIGYQYIQGRRFYRRWNATRGYWIDPYWIEG